jgi:hypothetical protein
MLGFLVTLLAKNSLKVAGTATTTTNKKIPMENNFKEVLLNIYSSMQESKNLCPLIKVLHQSIRVGHLRFRLRVQI